MNQRRQERLEVAIEKWVNAPERTADEVKDFIRRRAARMQAKATALLDTAAIAASYHGVDPLTPQDRADLEAAASGSAPPASGGGDGAPGAPRSRA